MPFSLPVTEKEKEGKIEGLKISADWEVVWDQRYAGAIYSGTKKPLQLGISVTCNMLHLPHYT